MIAYDFKGLHVIAKDCMNFQNIAWYFEGLHEIANKIAWDFKGLHIGLHRDCIGLHGILKNCMILHRIV